MYVLKNAYHLCTFLQVQRDSIESQLMIHFYFIKHYVAKLCLCDIAVVVKLWVMIHSWVMKSIWWDLGAILNGLEQTRKQQTFITSHKGEYLHSMCDYVNGPIATLCE